MKGMKFFCSYAWANKGGASGFGRAVFSNKLKCEADVSELEKILKLRNGFDELTIISWQRF